MSTESNSVKQVGLMTAMSPNLYRADEPRARKPRSWIRTQSGGGYE
jgi:hypothetical protein